MELSQCFADCADAPLPLGLPWYFVAIIVAVWLAALAAIVVLARRKLRLRRARREAESRRRQRRTGSELDLRDRR